MKRSTAVAIVFALGTGAPAGAQEAAPSFDCSAASGGVEEAICADAGLASLDRKLAEVYRKALGNLPAEDASREKALQRGWIKGRNECWKADDQHACVEAEYRTRIVELQIRSGQLMVPDPVGLVCEGEEGVPFTATFFRDTEPPSAVLTRGGDQVIAFLSPSGSGAKYEAANVEFWEHQGEASVEWFGTPLKCRVRR